MSYDRNGALSWTGFSLIVLGLGIKTWGLVRGWRSAANRAAWNSPLHDLSRQRRRDLRDQVRAREALNQGSVLLARDLAETTTLGRGSAEHLQAPSTTPRPLLLAVRRSSAVLG